MWKQFYTDIIVDFKEKYNRDLVNAFKILQDEGIIEIITCAATHGYLPLLSQDYSIENQIKIGIQNYKKHFQRNPIGIWLPECAYRPAYNWKNPIFTDEDEYARKGVEEILNKNGVKYFVIDTPVKNKTDFFLQKNQISFHRSQQTRSNPQEALYILLAQKNFPSCIRHTCLPSISFRKYSDADNFFSFFLCLRTKNICFLAPILCARFHRKACTKRRAHQNKHTTQLLVLLCRSNNKTNYFVGSDILHVQYLQTTIQHRL